VGKCSQGGGTYEESLEEICQQSEIVGTVHGLGLLLGMEIVEDKASKVPWARAADIIRRSSRDKGVLIHVAGTTRHILSISPPMIITKDEADRVCDVLAEVIKETEAQK